MEYQEVLAAHQELFPGVDYSNPASIDAFNKFWGQIEQLPEGAFPAIAAIWKAHPDQKAAFVNSYGGDLPSWLNAFQGWWEANGHSAVNNLSAYVPELQLLDKLGFVVNPDVQTTQLDPNNPNAIPLEQDLTGQIIHRGEADAAGDAARAAEANKIKGETNAALDAYLKTNQELLTGKFDAAGYLRANPDVAQWAQQQVAAGRFPDVATAAEQHYNEFGKAEGRSAGTVTRLQEENQQADEASNRVKAAAAAAAQTRLDSLAQRETDITAALNKVETDRKAALATMTTDRMGNVDARTAARTAALDAQTQQLRAGLATLETEKKAALQQLTTARVGAAEGQVTGINQALQSERDRITAQAAQQGFIGGSTMQDTALARASIGARQNAATVMGNAQVANATDTRTLGDEIAGTRFGITGNDATSRRGIGDEAAAGKYGISDEGAKLGYSISEDATKGRFNLADSLSQGRTGVADVLAGQTQAASDAATKLRLGYFDNDFARRLQASLIPAQIGATRLGLVDAAGTVGQAGFNRYLDTINKLFPAAGSPPPPSATSTTTTPSQIGAGIGSIGAAAAGTGLSLWLESLKKKPAGAGATTTPATGDFVYPGYG